MNPFYGGPNGQSFYIKAIFSSKNGIADSIRYDLSLGWTSPIGEGEFVVVAYGLPGDSTYEIYKQIDMDAEGKNFNSTLWQKCYDETKGNANGWYYKLVAAMAGHTPRFSIDKPIKILNANEDPKVDIDVSDPDYPILFFELPQSQVMQDPSAEIVGPTILPSVVLNQDDINSPKLEFKLPRATKFYWGDLLGERTAINYTLTDSSFAEYKVGDYYVNMRTGFIYLVTDVKDTTCDFKYTACIQSPLPEVDTIWISPYTEDGYQNKPNVTRSFTNNELTAWKLEFSLPKAPLVDADYNFVGSLDTGSVAASITSEDTVTFSFNIPAGSRVFAGKEIDDNNLTMEIPGARHGDLYINTSTGIVYALQENDEWITQQGSLKGPTGEALHIVRNYQIEAEDDFITGRDYIIDNYVDENDNPLPYASDEIFAVTFKDTTENAETAYWYFYTEDNTWGRVQLTGGTGDLILNEYQEGSVDNPLNDKVYSVDYVNSLIGQEIGNLDRTTFSKRQINELISWKTFSSLIPKEDLPEEGEEQGGTVNA